MGSIKDGKLLYHLTHMDNIEPILKDGLLPRSKLKDFRDVADKDIITGRAMSKLDEMVPFHWFAKNPFDGSVQRNHSDERFILITVRRDKAKGRNWKVVSRHPLSKDGAILDYDEGVNEINWEIMERRDYKDEICKLVCLSECLSPDIVSVDDFFMLYVSDEPSKEYVLRIAESSGADIDVCVNKFMFCR